MITSMLWLAVAFTALGLLTMLGAASCMADRDQIWPARFFDAGAGVFGLALLFWLAVAVFVLVARMYVP